MNQLFNMLGNSSNPLKPNLGSTQQQSPLSQMSHLMEFIKTTSPEQAKAQVEQLIKERGITGLCNAMNFNNLENAVGRLSDQNTQQTMQLGNGICNLGYELQGNIGQLGKEVALGQANLQLQASNNAAAASQQLATCCCDTQRAIDGVNYNAAQNTASINANTTAAVQKVLDAIQKDKIEALQGQVNQLQLQSALCGVVRYPNSTTFTAGYNPYFNANACGCGCGTTF